jgi:microcystin-dependent protein
MQYVGEVRIMAFNYAPEYWAQCNGQIMAISRTRRCSRCWAPPTAATACQTFALPDLRTMVPGGGISNPQGQSSGEYTHTLLQTEIPLHTHFPKVDATVAGSSNTSLAAAGNSFGQNSSSSTGQSGPAFNMYSTVVTPIAPLAPQALGGGAAASRTRTVSRS